MCLSLQILQRDFISFCFTVWLFCKCKMLTFFSVSGHVSFPSEYLTTRYEQNRICFKAQLYNDFSQWHNVEGDLSYSLHVLVGDLFEVCSAL